jgi:hypothetical protein
VLLERLAPLAAQLFEHLAQALDLFAVAIAEARLHGSPQRRVEIAVVQQVVGDLLEDRRRVQVEADLRAVPPRVADPVGLAHARTVPASAPARTSRARTRAAPPPTGPCAKDERRRPGSDRGCRVQDGA